MVFPIFNLKKNNGGLIITQLSKREKPFKELASRTVGFKVKDLQKTASWFEKHGAQLVFFGRLIPLIRSLVSIPAGLTKMKLSKFILFTVLGSGIWNSIWISLGFLLGDQWTKAEKYTKYIDLLVNIGIGIFIVFLLYKVFQNYQKRKNNQV